MVGLGLAGLAAVIFYFIASIFDRRIEPRLAMVGEVCEYTYFLILMTSWHYLMNFYNE